MEVRIKTGRGFGNRSGALMSTVLKQPQTGTQKVILRRVSWETYEHLLEDYLDQSNPRFTYDNGVLEIMSPSAKHERFNRLLADFIMVVALEWDIDFDNVGSNTFKRKDLQQGFEPDSSFYFQNVERIRDKEQIDLKSDPPPDLVIEIDIYSSSLERFPIFAGVGVPEVWHYDGKSVTIFELKGQEYRPREASLTLPKVTAQMMTKLLRESKKMKRTDWLRRVRD